MEDYIEDYKYNNCFWKKSGTLYTHSDYKYEEYISVGIIFQKLSSKMYEFSEFLGTLKKEYKKPKEPSYTREDGIKVILSSINTLKNEYENLASKIEEIANKILEKKDTYDSKKEATKMCDDAFKKYDTELKKLTMVKKSYYDTMNKVVETFINQKYGKKGENNKSKQDLKNKLKNLEKKKEEYKKVVESVENLRTEYMEEQGNIFADKEEMERECTDELKRYFKEFIKNIEDFNKNIKIKEEDINIIENIDGEKDTQSFAEANKSLMTGPKRNTYKEYAVDINYYTEHFEIIKSKIKDKSPKEVREFQYELSTEITNLLSHFLKEEKTEIIQRIEEISKDLKDNRLSPKEHKYLLDRFQEGYDNFIKWKNEKVGNQEYRKVGKEWDERFLYMHTFLRYFNKKRVESKELNEENFNYLYEAIKKIFELNENENVDYNLCDLAVTLCSTFYKKDPNGKDGKKYINEVIKDISIFQKQGFWVGLTRFALNEEIQKQNKIEDTLKENNITEEKLNNSVIAKLMSISFNIMNYVLDSDLFNRIIYDIFKYCKINEENKKFIVEMLESQIENEKINYLKLDKDLLFSDGKEQK